MVMNKTTKKLKPLFTFSSTKYMANSKNSANTTMRIYSKENKLKTTHMMK